MARRRSPSQLVSVELNLTSMLDVVFNILAFFVMTFSPPEQERNYDVNLPPPRLQEKAEAAPEGEGQLPTEEPALFDEVTIYLEAGAGGGLAGIRLEQQVIPVQGPGGTAALADRLRATIGVLGGAGKNKIEAATIIAPSALKYQYVIAAVDACYNAGLKKINFAESNAAAPIR